MTDGPYTLTRGPSSSQGTFGLLTDPNGIPLCVTVEKPWADNEPCVSCVPPGSYCFTRYASPSKGTVWKTEDVPGRYGIEIHAANLADELLGCIAVGQYFTTFNGVMGVTNSVVMLNFLRAKLPAVFYLTIK